MNHKVARANQAIANADILNRLKAFHPQVVSTIFVSLDTADSDIDIVCSYKAQTAFIRTFADAYGDFECYSLRANLDYALGQFYYDQFLIEVYASTTPVRLQPAFRHYQMMKRLVDIGGDSFINSVRQLKQRGLKTEPAICQVLDISGDPYAAVLELERWSDDKLKKRIHVSD